MVSELVQESKRTPNGKQVRQLQQACHCFSFLTPMSRSLTKTVPCRQGHALGLHLRMHVKQCMSRSSELAAYIQMFCCVMFENSLTGNLNMAEKPTPLKRSCLSSMKRMHSTAGFYKACENRSPQACCLASLVVRYGRDRHDRGGRTVRQAKRPRL